MKEQIVFFGTGPVSLATLVGIADHFEFEAIITKPDNTGASRNKNERSVANFGKTKGIKVLEPANSGELCQLAGQKWHSRAGLVVDYGLIIPQEMIDDFPLGIVNSHFSLLPKWRGADPITAVLLAGDEKTGVTLMNIVQKLDEGPVFAQQELAISQVENIQTLTEKLVTLSNKMIQTDLPKYITHELTPKPQLGEPTYSHKIQKSDGEIDWTKPAVQIEREVRAYLGWPGSYTKLFDRDVIITTAHVEKAQGTPGATQIEDKELLVYCSQDALTIDKIKPAGKSEMIAADFIRGYVK